MGYRTLRSCLQELEKTGELARISTEVDPNLEMAAIHRQVYDAGGPALLFEHVKDSPFQALSNLYGTFLRTEYLFRREIEKVQFLGKLKTDPSALFSSFPSGLGKSFHGIYALPLKGNWKRAGFRKTTIDALPHIRSWPGDGGAFITLPQVLSLPAGEKDIQKANLGMYRIQISGNDYEEGKEVGLHYQLHRGIGNHQKTYIESGEPFHISIFVGGPPAHTLSAIMPLPEDLSEVSFAGILNSRRFRYARQGNYYMSLDADFIITGKILPEVLKEEGPFGDHLGYYSLAHLFPVMKVEEVWHRNDPVWHFTVVGRPPQEDSSFGHLIHLLTSEISMSEYPGIRELHAVDAAGVHPLLLSVGSERYMPFREKEPSPEEILTQANHLLGKGQTSLAKYLLITAPIKNETINTHDIPGFLDYFLRRFRPERDLHFYTNSSIDTLDYSGTGWNRGSKVVMACYGPEVRELNVEIPGPLSGIEEIKDSKTVLPGILMIQLKPDTEVTTFVNSLEKIPENLLEGFPWIVIADDVKFVSLNLNNFLWITFTRSNPADDIFGVRSFIEKKHWGCHGPVIIDARNKPHHAPELETNPEVERRAQEIIEKNNIDIS